MAWGRNSGNSDESSEPKPSLWLRFQNAVVKPDDLEESKKAKAQADDRSVEEIQAEIKTASDKERAIGLIAAPVGALISFIIITALIDHDRATELATGTTAKLQANISTYHELLIVMLVLSVVMLVTAMMRKRFFLGMAMALFGLSAFNLHYWGFGVPFIMGGAWYLVRTWRLNQSLKLAKGDDSIPKSRKANFTPQSPRPRPNKRYTPPTN